MKGMKPMMQKLYLECYAGISGDMTVGALLDLGADENRLRKTLESLAPDGYSIEVSRVKKAGLDVCDFAVKLDAAHENHDHDMEYLHHPAEHSSLHEHPHHHTHRGLPEILEIFEKSDMTARAKATAGRIFRILAEAEAKAHGVPLSEVHFHEVGAVDSIVDVAAVAICLDDLGIEEVIVPALCEGCGTIRCQHGMIPIPAPATLNIVSAYHLPLHQTETFGEFVTPTGAAIVAAVCTERELPARYTVDKIGLGAGKRTYERPSILRAMLLTPKAEAGDRIVKLECNLDDCTGEMLGYAMERLFAAGAREVFYTPVFMKKNRPGYLLTTLCMPEDAGAMEEILFSETSTIGVRRMLMERTVLPREVSVVQTTAGEVRVKTVPRGAGVRRIPEYESVAALARMQGIPFRDLYRKIEAEINAG